MAYADYISKFAPSLHIFLDFRLIYRKTYRTMSDSSWTSEEMTPTVSPEKRDSVNETLSDEEFFSAVSTANNSRRTSERRSSENHILSARDTASTRRKSLLKPVEFPNYTTEPVVQKPAGSVTPKNQEYWLQSLPSSEYKPGEGFLKPAEQLSDPNRKSDTPKHVDNSDTNILADKAQMSILSHYSDIQRDIHESSVTEKYPTDEENTSEEEYSEVYTDYDHSGSSSDETDIDRKIEMMMNKLMGIKDPSNDDSLGDESQTDLILKMLGSFAPPSVSTVPPVLQAGGTEKRKRGLVKKKVRRRHQRSALTAPGAALFVKFQDFMKEASSHSAFARGVFGERLLLNDEDENRFKVISTAKIREAGLDK